jgi:hypothetical protein
MTPSTNDKSVILYHIKSDTKTRNEDFEKAWKTYGQITEERWLDDPTLWTPRPDGSAAWRELGLAHVLALALDTGHAVVVSITGTEAIANAKSTEE